LLVALQSGYEFMQETEPGLGGGGLYRRV